MTSLPPQQQQQQQRFRQLYRSIEHGDDTKVLHMAEEILKNDHRDGDAIKSKMVALIHLGRYEDGLAFLDQQQQQQGSSQEDLLIMERAYCLYRLNRYEEVEKLNLSSQDDQHLVHQTKYRMKNYADTISFYNAEMDRLSQSEVERRNEVITNRIAAQILEGELGDVVAKSRSDGYGYEALFNVGCAHVALGQFDEALTILQQASDLCVKNLTQEEYTREEIDDELAGIRLQMAFVHHMNGHLEKAKQLYQTVIDSKPSDKTCIAVANNNLASLKTGQGSESLFDTQRKLTSGMHGDLMQKMSPEQQRILKMNHCLLLMHMRKKEACLREVEVLERQFPQSDIPVIVHASLLYREHKYPDAKKLLIQFVEEGIKTNINVTRSLLTLCQMELSKLGNTESTLTILKQYGSKLGDGFLSRPGIIGAIVSLYLRQNDIEGAIHALNEAIDQCDSKNNDRLYPLLLAKGDIHTRIANDHASAVETYKRVLKVTKEGSVLYYKALALLVDSLSHVDLEQARQYAERLPSVDLSDMDLEEVEHSATSGDQGERLLAMQMRQMQLSKEVQSMMIEDDDDDQFGKGVKSEKKKRQRKRKNKLPQNFDPNKKPNPERWIPMSERSNVKKMQKKTTDMGSMKQMSKHQGASLPTQQSSSPKIATSVQPNNNSNNKNKNNATKKPKSKSKKSKR